MGREGEGEREGRGKREGDGKGGEKWGMKGAWEWREIEGNWKW